MTKLAAAPVNTLTPRRNATSSTREGHGGFGPHLAIQRDGAGPMSMGAPGLIRNVVGSPGAPLDPRLRSIMEPQLGYDFSNVRVHTDTPAAQSAEAIGANAYTAGDHIVFGAGRFDPHSPGGQRLVAHELAHVIQQSNGPITGHALDGDVSVSTPDDSFERAAARLSDNTMQGQGQAGASRGAILPLPARSNSQGQIAVQRDWNSAGAIAGIVGAVAGVAALGIALWAWLRPRNPAPTTGGITLNSQPISSVDPNGVPPDRQDAALSATTHTEKLLDMKTDGDNWADINFDVDTDGVSIFSAIPQTMPHNYNGGTGGSSAIINFAAPTTVAVPKYDTTPKPDPAKKEAPKKAPPKGKGKEEAPPPPPPAPKDTPGVLQVPFNGTNSVGEKESLQQFAGRFVIRANPAGHRMVECVECVPRNQIGFASTDNQKIGHVDYHGHAAPAQQNTPPAPGPQQSQPIPPPSTGAR